MKIRHYQVRMSAMAAMRVVGAMLAICGVVRAQSLIEAEGVAEARQAFASPDTAARVRCSFTPERPNLRYDLQFHTGYSIAIPLAQLSGSEHTLTVLLRVTPERGEPVYLSRTEGVPIVPAGKLEGEFTGDFVVGEGAYVVDAVVRDEARALCVGKWRVQAKRAGGERDLHPVTTPSSVHDDSNRGGPPFVESRAAIERLTILMHAAALRPRAAKIEDATVQTLEQSLSSLCSQLAARSVRLVVFNADQHKILLRKDGFTAADLPQVTSALESMELARVDYRTLQNRDKADLLSDLVDKEIHDSQLASAVIFLGPRTPSSLDPAFQPDPQTVARARWFYLQYEALERIPNQPFGRRGYGMGRGDMDEPDVGGGGGRGRRGMTGGLPAPTDPPTYRDGPDGVEQLLRRIRGEIIPVRSPHEFAEALVRMRSQIPADQLVFRERGLDSALLRFAAGVFERRDPKFENQPAWLARFEIDVIRLVGIRKIFHIGAARPGNRANCRRPCYGRNAASLEPIAAILYPQYSSRDRMVPGT